MNILKYSEKFEMSLDVLLKFLSFSWRYWGNICAYRVLVCFCVCQFVFEVMSSLASP
jgi:TRAP-type C4-dicarboxylate transport system permease small subunit